EYPLHGYFVTLEYRIFFFGVSPCLSNNSDIVTNSYPCSTSLGKAIFNASTVLSLPAESCIR
ncbi:MAG: hypothetical protein WBK46_13580, partial [Ruminococcus flavefaciens]